MASPPQEILLASSPDGPITAYDASTGTVLAWFSGSQSPRRGLTLAGNAMVAASHISSDATSGSIHLYNWWSHIAFQHFPVPEPVAPLTSTPDGSYLFCGGLSGYIHILALPSGELLRSFHAHCRAVSCLIINDDSSLLVSGGDDGAICVFPIIRLLDSSSSTHHHQLALYHFVGHGSPVTAISIGVGGCSSTIISCLLDCTCKFWSLTYGSDIRTLRFPCIIWNLAVDPTESQFYAGGSDGKIYVGITKVNRRQPMVTDAELIVWTPEHDGAVTAMTMVNEGLNVVSASEDGSIRIWEAESGALIRVIAYERGSISDLVVAKGVRDHRRFGIIPGTVSFDRAGQTLGYTCGEISRPVREVSEMEDALNVVVKDRRRAIDTLEAAISTYGRLLGLILKEAKAEEGTNSNKKKAQR